MPRLLVTNTETIRAENGNEFNIKLYGRDPDGKPDDVEVRGFRPYFYAPKHEVEDREHELLYNESIQEIADEAEALTGQPVVRIYTPTPQDIRDAKELFNQTYEADVSFTNRFRIDNELVAWFEYPESPCHHNEIKPVDAPEGEDPDPRILTFDIEVDDRHGFPKHGEQSVLSIVAHDSYEGEYVGFIHLGGRPVEEVFPDGKPEELDKLYFEPDEKRMLIRFACWVKEHDPDLITAWNSDFDVPYLIERMQKIGVNPGRMSREGKAFVKRNGEPRIVGRTVYDMLEVYKANSWGELDSYKLDDVAADVLGERKVKFDGLVYDLWADDPTTLMNYNGRDVRLTVEINEAEEVIAFRDALRKQVGVDFEDSLNASDFAEMNARRKLHEWGKVGPTAEYKPKEKKYEGAVVFEPYTGVAKNVVGMDLASLYPMTMWMLNSSMETKVDPEAIVWDEETGEGVAVIDGEEVPVAMAPNGVAFRLDVDGLFRALVDDALALKSHYKKLKNNAETKEEREYYETKYNVSKTITNSYYGVMGWERFFLYDEDVAEAVTTMGQAVIKRTQHFIEEDTPGEVIYGDTDSNYVKLPRNWTKASCIEAADEFATELNEVVYPELAEKHGMPADENKWEIEVEAYIERFFQAGKKKRYAYLATWKDGRDIEPSITIKGFDTARSDTAPLTGELQTKVLKKILYGADKTELGNLVYEAAQKIDPTDPDWDAIGIPGGLNKAIHEACDCDDCYSWSTTGHYPKDAHPRGAWFANQLGYGNFDKGSKPKRVYVQAFRHENVSGEIDVLAFDDPDDLPEKAMIDAGRMTKTLVVNPLRQILSAVDVDVEAAVRGQLQTGLSAFM